MTKFELFLATVTLSLLFIVGAVPVAKNILRKGNGTMELECRFGNFCDQFVDKSTRDKLGRRSNCVQFFLAVCRRHHSNGSTLVKATI